jgi:hypothetical protein
MLREQWFRRVGLNAEISLVFAHKRRKTMCVSSELQLACENPGSFVLSAAAMQCGRLHT